MDTQRDVSGLDLPDDPEDLDEAPTARVRALRDRCRAEERRLSYVRRMVQGHLDLADAELARRGGAPAEALVGRVTRTLTGPARPGVSRRAVALYAPAGEDAAVVDGDTTARLPDLDDSALAAHVDELRRRERALSDRRALLLGRLDRLQATLVARYRDGRADVDDLTGRLEPG